MRPRPGQKKDVEVKSHSDIYFGAALDMDSWTGLFRAFQRRKGKAERRKYSFSMSPEALPRLPMDAIGLQ